MSSLIAIILIVVTHTLITISCFKLELNNWHKGFYTLVLVVCAILQNRLFEFLVTP